MRFEQRQQIVAVVTIPTILSLLLLVFVLRNSLHEWAIERWSRDQLAFVSVLADRLNSNIQQASTVLRVASRLSTFSALPERKHIDRRINGLPEQMEPEKRRALEALRQQGGFSVLFVLTPEGDHYISHPFDVQRSLKKYNLADRPYFQAAQRSGELVVSNSFIGADGVPAVAIDIPVLDADGRIVLHLGGVLHLTNLSTLLSRSGIAPFDGAVLTDRRGERIADTNPQLLTQPLGEPLRSHPAFAEPSPQSPQSQDSSPRRTAGSIAVARSTNMHGVEATRITDHAGTDWLTFDTALENGWRFFVFRRLSHIHEDIAPQVRNATLLAAGILLIPATLGLYMALRFSRRWRRTDLALKQANATLAQKIAERTAALQQSEIRHRTLFESTADAVLVLDEQVVIDCNPAAVRMFGAARREDLVGRHPAELSPAQQADGVDSLSAANERKTTVLTTGSTSFEWLHRRLDNGEAFVAEVLLSRLEIDGQRLVQATVRDITGRRRAEAELRKLSLAVEQSPNSIVITDTDARIEYVNDRFVEISGYAREEMLGQNPKMLQSGLTPPEIYQRMWQALSSGHSFEGEFTNRRKNGETYVELARFAPIREADGTVTHYLAIKEDITEKKRTEEELERHRSHLEELVRERTTQLAEAKDVAEAATRSKSAFLANMSHEIRTPLNAITGLTYLMKRDGVSPAQADRLEKIAGAGQHLLAIINDILDLSKIEAGKIGLEQVDVSLRTIAANIVSMLQERAQAKGIRLLIDIAALPDKLQGDPTRISQALLNYAGNAVKFTERGEITLRMRCLAEDEDSALIRVEVADSGPGIDAETQARLFNAFEQADNSISRRHGGTGLGLAITRRLAELMGGESGVVSAPGQGSTFWFTLRLHKSHGHAAPGHTPVQENAEHELRERYRGRRILLVEDEPINREVALELLRDTGLAVDVVADGEEAVAAAESGGYDLILMDMQMPRLDGLAASRRIRALPACADTLIVAMTANAFSEDRAHCLEAGMVDFVAKPIDPEHLFSTLLRCLSGGPRAARKTLP